LTWEKRKAYQERSNERRRQTTGMPRTNFPTQQHQYGPKKDMKTTAYHCSERKTVEKNS